MQIHPASDVVPDGRGFVGRQSRFQGVVAAVVMTGILCGIPAVTWYYDAHWLLWTISGGIALLIVPLIVSDAAARFRRTNWLLWLDADGLWINLRSYQTGRDGDPPTVVRLRYDEIASAAQRVETYLLPASKGGTVRHRERSIDLRLKQPGTEELRAALEGERNHLGKGRTYAGGITVTTRACLYPVSAPENDLVRVLWRSGQGHHASPSLAAVLGELESHGVPIGEPSALDRGRLDGLSEAELHDLVRNLAGSGGALAAAKLLKERCGLTTAEARREVDAITGKQPPPQA